MSKNRTEEMKRLINCEVVAKVKYYGIEITVISK